MIVYPAVIKNEGFRNYAIRKDTIDDKIKLEFVLKIKVTSGISKRAVRSTNGIAFKMVSIGELESNLEKVKFSDFNEDDFKKWTGTDFNSLTWRDNVPEKI